MTTATTQMTASRPRPLRQAGPRLAVAVVTAMAVFGIIVAAWQIQAGQSSGPAAVGEAVATDYGSLTVTRTNQTFVPDTQGPPTMAQMSGVNGADQLQVWVRFVNTEADQGVRYDPEWFRLVHAAEPGHTVRIAGSSLTPDRLRFGSSIEGQLWFELATLPVGRYRLEYAAPESETLRIALGRLDPTVVTDDHPNSHDHRKPNSTPNSRPGNPHAH
jgi:hypothetical protein